eukprot:361747-Chlamydomonas_euryale.AAC.12
MRHIKRATVHASWHPGKHAVPMRRGTQAGAQRSMRLGTQASMPCPCVVARRQARNGQCIAPGLQMRRGKRMLSHACPQGRASWPASCMPREFTHACGGHTGTTPGQLHAHAADMRIALQCTTGLHAPHAHTGALHAGHACSGAPHARSANGHGFFSTTRSARARCMHGTSMHGTSKHVHARPCTARPCIHGTSMRPTLSFIFISESRAPLVGSIVGGGAGVALDEAAAVSGRAAVAGGGGLRGRGAAGFGLGFGFFGSADVRLTLPALI